jgi:hypothetical protein
MLGHEGGINCCPAHTLNCLTCYGERKRVKYRPFMSWLCNWVMPFVGLLMSIERHEVLLADYFHPFKWYDCTVCASTGKQAIPWECLDG